MKNKLVLGLFLYAVSSAIAKEAHSFRIPKPSLEEAITLVKKHHEMQPGNLKNIFIDEAIFVREPATAFWRIGVRNSAYETGHLIYTVSPDGIVKIDTVIKDG